MHIEPTENAELLEQAAAEIEQAVGELNSELRAKEEADKYGIRGKVSSPGNGSILGERMIEYGEQCARGLEQLGQEFLDVATKFEADCREKAELMRQLAKRQAELATRYTEKMKSVDGIINGE